MSLPAIFPRCTCEWIGTKELQSRCLAALARKSDVLGHIRLCHRLPVHLDRPHKVVDRQQGFEQLIRLDICPGLFNGARSSGGAGCQLLHLDAGVIG